MLLHNLVCVLYLAIIHQSAGDIKMTTNQGIIQYQTLQSFYEGLVYFTTETTLIFVADNEQLTISLTGGY